MPEAEPVAVHAAWGLALLVAGLLVCFAGARSVRVAAACAGFGTGSVLVDALGGGVLASVVVGASGAVAGVLLTGLVVRTGFAVVGALAGAAVVAAWLRTFSVVGFSPVLVLVLVLAGALLGGVGASQVRSPITAVVTALGGAALALRGVVELGPAPLAFLRDAETVAGGVVATVVWVALAAAGWATQRRSTPGRTADR